MFKLTKITFSTENLFNFVCPVTNTENIILKEIYCVVCCENQITDGHTDRFESPKYVSANPSSFFTNSYNKNVNI